MKLGKLQLKIMSVLWNSAPLTVAQVRARLTGESLAYTTVATMLRKMEERGLVTHREAGRKFAYEPLVSSDEVARSMSDEFVDWLCGGSVAGAVQHLLTSREIDASELDALEALIQQRRDDQHEAASD